jgi:2-methylcitrate dehydratase PrpD
MSILSDAASWISGLSLGDIPPRVVDKVRHQTLNMLAAAMAGTRTRVGSSLIMALPESGGKAWSLPGGRNYSLEEALLIGCSLTMTLDYDDYLVFGHTGHSAVITSLVLGDLEGKSLEEVIPAMTAANEIAGRLGAATLLGPRNGQMWSYIHLAGGAAAASHILGLDEEKTTHAMALALYQPVLPLYPGFMGGESKVLTAAVPTITGVQAALLARAGLKGNPQIMEGEGGFLDELSFVPAPFFLEGWGQAWVSDTLTYKPYPGCAYLDTTLDAWEQIRSDIVGRGDQPLNPGDIEEIRVEASLLTIGMDDLSQAFRGSTPLAPVNINFSMATSLALAILNQRLTPGCLEPSYLEDNGQEILELASRVLLVHDWQATFELLETLDLTLDLGAVFRNFSIAQLLALRRDLKGMLSHSALGWQDMREAIRHLPPSFKQGLSKSLRLRLQRYRGAPGPAPFDMGKVKMEDLRLPFPSRLTIRLRGGKEYSARCSIPRGAPGGPTYLEEIPLKWQRESASRLGEEGAVQVSRMVLDENPPLNALLDNLTP